MAANRITALVVNYASAGETIQLVQSLLPEIPSIVVNNDSRETEILENSLSRVAGAALIQAPSNIGYGRAMNLALEAADTPLVALLNPDIHISTSDISTVSEILKAEGATIVAPRLIDEEGAVWRTAFTQGLGVRSLLVDWLVGFAGSRHALTTILRGFSGANRSFGGRGAVEAITGAVWVADRSALLSAGGFDSRFFLYGEETDLCRRVKLSGGKILFDPRICVLHRGGGSAEGQRQTLRRLESTVLAFEVMGRTWVARLVRAYVWFFMAKRRLWGMHGHT